MKAAKLLTTLLFAAGLLVPLSALADVQITEIMYDVSGSDTGREWVEVTNTGSSAVDLSTYKFFENNTNHALVVTEGTGVLTPGASGIIADDPTKFKIDWPNYAGALFDSSFSLSNVGEALAVKDGSLTTLDSVTYDPSVGAAGDGNSLTRQGATFVATAATPGTYGSSSGSASSPDTTQTSTTSTEIVSSNSSSNFAGPPPITAHIQGDSEVMVGGGSFFVGQAYGTSGLPLSSARFLWNFGDGATAEGQKVFHTYSYPGKYVVVLTAANNFSTAADRFTVSAIASQVSLVAEGDGSLTISNSSNNDIDLGYWVLVESGNHFVIPEGTTVLAHEGVRFSPTILQFSGSTAAQLLYPNESPAASATPGAHSPLRGERVPAAPTLSAPVTFSSPNIQTDTTPEPTVAATENLPDLGAATAAADATFPWWAWFVALGALIVLGAAATYYARALTHAPETETVLSAEEFDIE